MREILHGITRLCCWTTVKRTFLSSFWQLTEIHLPIQEIHLPFSLIHTISPAIFCCFICNTPQAIIYLFVLRHSAVLPNVRFPFHSFLHHIRISSVTRDFRTSCLVLWPSVCSPALVTVDLKCSHLPFRSALSCFSAILQLCQSRIWVVPPSFIFSRFQRCITFRTFFSFTLNLATTWLWSDSSRFLDGCALHTHYFNIYVWLICFQASSTCIESSVLSKPGISDAHLSSFAKSTNICPRSLRYPKP